MINFSAFFTPASEAIKLTVFGLSPEITRIETPRSCKKLTVSWTFGRSAFLSVIIAIGESLSFSKRFLILPDFSNLASRRTRRPFEASTSISFESLLNSDLFARFFKINSGAPKTIDSSVDLFFEKVIPESFRELEKAI